MNKCKVCGNSFFHQPLLTYNNMPNGAQYMPDEETLKQDKLIVLEVMQCSGCGLVQLNNNPVHYYREVIRAASVSKEMYLFRKKQFLRLVEEYRLKNKKIVEIACGCGEYLKIMDELEVDAYGIEYCEASVKKCRQNGLDVSKGYLDYDNQKIEKGPYDGFFMLNYLEHSPNPNVLLRGIYNNLEDDAIGIIEVPNFNMIIKENLFSEFISDHLMYFTKETLIFTLNKNGFDILECNELWDQYIISAVVRKKKQLNLSFFEKTKKSLIKQIIDYINRFPNERVAIWGAGHQALTMMALADLGKKVKYVIDSAKFKQGKLTQGTHIPIIAPDKLNSEWADAVIIMGAGYSDEIANIVLKTHKDMEIAILRKSNLEIIK